MDERYYIEDLEGKILKAIEKASNTAEICSSLNCGEDLQYGDVTRTDIECQLAGIIEMAEIIRLIDVYLEWFPETAAGEEFQGQRERSRANQRNLRVEMLAYFDWLKERIAAE